ncbi:MAG TPA: hypothetical protein VEB68_02275 [Croceibacterium sp.]|nr:hypothetical protein [Propylenella sp.]HYD23594.1 hypothetical protein [Croceibacterium sp.]
MAESNTSGWPPYARVPPFLPVPLRARADGWTPERQARFIGFLAETGSVAAAARRVGMSRESAHRLRRRPHAASFAHAWEAIVALRGGGPLHHRKITAEELAELAFHGPFHILIRRQRFVRTWRKPSTSALLRHLRRLEARAAPGGWDR